MRKISQVARAALVITLLLPPSTMLWNAEARAKSVRAPAEAKILRRKPERIVQADILSSQGEFSGKTANELISMGKGFQTLIKNEKSEEKKTKLLFAEAGTYLALARHYRSRPSLSALDKKNQRDANARVIKGLTPIVNRSSESSAHRSRAAYLLGLAYLNQNNEPQAVQSFKASIDAEPSAQYASALSLFLAEQAFETDRYQESLDIFTAHFKSYNDSQRALAVYKMAWCYINLDNLPMAEKNLLLIAGKEAAGPFGFDGFKDLAYVMTLHRNDREIIEFARQNFSEDKDKQTDFLLQVYSYFQTQSSTKRKPELLAELTRAEKDPVKRLRILVATLKGSQREFAAAEPFQEFERIRIEIEKSGWKTTLPGWSDMAEELEQELFQLIRAHADTLNGRLKPEGGLDASEITDHLIQALQFHVTYYPQSKERQNSYVLWIKVCDQQKRYKCSFDISTRIIDDGKASAELKQTAQMTRLRSLDQLISENPELKPQLKTSLEQFLKDRKVDADWLVAAKRLTAILTEEQKFGQSLTWLQKIHDREQSTESNYRLQLARFQAEDFAAVTGSNFKLGKDPLSQQTQGLIRESHLKLAQKNLVGDQFADYAKNVSEFLKTHPDSDKADAARRSLLDQFLQRKMFDKVAEQLEAMPSTIRMRSYAEQTGSLARHLLKQGEFAKVMALTQDWAKSAQKSELEIYFVSAAAGQGVGGITIQDPKAREYLFGVWALTNPALVLKAYDQQKPKTINEKRLLLLALQVEQKRIDPQVPARYRTALKGIYEGGAEKSPSKSLAEYLKINFPTTSVKGAQYESLAQAAAEKVRALRVRVVKDLDGRQADDQVAILKAATTAEKRVAEVLLAAPIPAGLDKKDTAEYRKGIAELAGEFSKQANEYEKLSQGIQRAAGALAAKGILPYPKLGQWPVFSGDAGKTITRLMNRKQEAGALIALDQWKADGSIDGDRYFQMRSRILFSGPNNAGVSNYVAAELGESGQRALLEKWKSFPMEASAAKQ